MFVLVLLKGFAAGPYWNQAGDGSNYLCLPAEPQFKTVLSGFHAHHAQGRISGVEYGLWNDDVHMNNPFENSNTGGVDINEQAAPCAVCFAEARSALLTIPARTECPSGWTTEYGGYLMSESHGTAHGERYRSSYLCWDEAPEIASGGVANQDQATVYPVEVECGTLPCSVYPNGKELACMVCTK